MALQRRKDSDDMVKEQGKLVAQVMKEKTSAQEWEKNWGFLKNKNGLLENEAFRQGWSKEEYWDAIQSLESMNSSRSVLNVSPLPATEKFPKTSSEVIGLRCMHLLEKNVKPKTSSIKLQEQQNYIFLG